MRSVGASYNIFAPYRCKAQTSALCAIKMIKKIFTLVSTLKLGLLETSIKHGQSSQAVFFVQFYLETQQMQNMVRNDIECT